MNKLCSLFFQCFSLKKSLHPCEIAPTVEAPPPTEKPNRLIKLKLILNNISLDQRPVDTLSGSVEIENIVGLLEQFIKTIERLTVVCPKEVQSQVIDQLVGDQIESVFKKLIQLEQDPKYNAKFKEIVGLLQQWLNHEVIDVAHLQKLLANNLITSSEEKNTLTIDSKGFNQYLKNFTKNCLCLYEITHKHLAPLNATQTICFYRFIVIIALCITLFLLIELVALLILNTPLERIFTSSFFSLVFLNVLILLLQSSYSQCIKIANNVFMAELKSKFLPQAPATPQSV